MAVFASKKRGAFILLEGLDRCGKTTQAVLLQAHLATNGIVSERINFPNRTTATGQLIDFFLRGETEIKNDHAVHLLFSANRWEQTASIEAKLLSGCTLVCDRYAFSGLAFSAAKGLDPDWCKEPDCGLPAPDCVIFLDIQAQDAGARGDFGKERFEKVDFQNEVRGQFMDLRADVKDLDVPIPWQMVDASQSIESIQIQIAAIAHDVIASVQDTPINCLTW